MFWLPAGGSKTWDHPGEILKDGFVPLHLKPRPLLQGPRVICGIFGSLSSSVNVVSGPNSQGGDLLVRKEESVEELTSLFHGDPVMAFSVYGGFHHCTLKPERARAPSPSLGHSL